MTLESSDRIVVNAPAQAVDTAGASGRTGWRRADDRIVVRASGADCASFLHGMCSNDIKGMTTGSVLQALLLDDRARIVADLFVWAAPDAFLLDFDRALWPKAREHLEKFLVADDVEFNEQAGLNLLDLEGESAAVVGDRIVSGARTLAEWHAMFAGELSIANLPRFGTRAFSIMAADDAIDRVVTAIGTMGDVDPLDANTLDAIRIARGIARVGVDTDEKTLALEARFERAISFAKGCYIGQETIERATAHGSLKKMLCGLKIARGPKPDANASITLGDRVVGRLTSVATMPGGDIIGLAILHRDAWPDGTEVTIGDPAHGWRATVKELPLK
jgi:aminomethyltransferase